VLSLNKNLILGQYIKVLKTRKWFVSFFKGTFSAINYFAC